MSAQLPTDPPRPLISVVSASWNQGRFIEECLKSVQGLPEGLLEHVVIDNCSDDETPEVLARHPEVRAVIEADRGQSHALNKGFRAARGEWVLWLNVDDFLLPGAIERLYQAVQEKGAGTDLIYGHMVFVDAASSKIRTIYQPKWHFWMTKWGGYVAPSTGSLFRRECLLAEPLDEDFHIIMDTEWTLRVGENLRVTRLDAEIVAFRVGDNKTAQHITHGTLTPRHREERAILSQKYPFFPDQLDARSMSLRKMSQILKQKGVRVVSLIDKAFSRRKAAKHL